MRRRSFLAGIGLALGAVGCAALPWITTNGPLILGVIQDAVIIVEQIEAFVAQYFQAHPNQAQQQKVAAAITKTREVIDGIAKLMAGGLAMTQAQLTQAESDFTAAWNDLMALVGPLGVSTVPKGSAKKAVAGALIVEEPAMLHVVHK